MPRIRSTRTTSSEALDATKVTLRAIQASADAFPPLKSAVSSVLVVLDLSENVRSNKKGCKHVATRAAQLVQDIWSQTKDLAIVLPSEAKESIRQIRRCVRNKNRIDEYGRLLDEAMMHFSINLELSLHRMNANLHRLHAKSAAAQDAILVASEMSESERLLLMQIRGDVHIGKLAAVSFFF
ncbi:hypothetical protein FB45DRAFT_949618 [Roridomyces roridus]|uniref:Uncharacterized protein n=1 Tax=Roridomyces roridus TaxID=1738132 RepID=A0AAD7B0J4_9AGAR|nr:hypothetical protein FB45DRAFT_949618 [Roridomyces roridus]